MIISISFMRAVFFCTTRSLVTVVSKLQQVLGTTLLARCLPPTPALQRAASVLPQRLLPEASAAICHRENQSPCHSGDGLRISWSLNPSSRASSSRSKSLLTPSDQFESESTHSNHTWKSRCHANIQKKPTIFSRSSFADAPLTKDAIAEVLPMYHTALLPRTRSGHWSIVSGIIAASQS